MKSSATRAIALAVMSFAFSNGLAVAQANDGSADSDTTDLVAAQVRDQGYEFQDPTDAKRDQAASQPNETVWTLTCKNANYRVRLVPDMSADIERID